MTTESNPAELDISPIERLTNNLKAIRALMVPLQQAGHEVMSGRTSLLSYHEQFSKGMGANSLLTRIRLRDEMELFLEMLESINAVLLVKDLEREVGQGSWRAMASTCHLVSAVRDLREHVGPGVTLRQAKLVIEAYQSGLFE